MNLTKFFLSTLAYAFVNTALAVVWHENIFGELYRGFNIYSNPDNPNIPLAALGTLIEGAVLNYLFMRFAPESNRMSFGMILGILLCLFASSYGVFQTAAIEKVQGAGTGSFIAVECTVMLLYGIIGGCLVSLIYKSKTVKQ